MELFLFVFNNTTLITRGRSDGAFQPVRLPHDARLAQNSELKSQMGALKAAGPGPDYLAKQVLDWATAHPEDPRNPEALALAVKTSGFSCATKTNNVERVFRLLHTRYPNSEWTKKTPYWFK